MGKSETGLDCSGRGFNPRPAGVFAWRESFAIWSHRSSGAVFLAPAAVVVLAFSIFPLLASLYLSLSRFKFTRDGFSLRWAGFANYKKLLLGSEQYHFLGKLSPLHWAEVVLLAALAVAAGWGLVRRAKAGGGTVGLVGRFVAAVLSLALLALLFSTLRGGAPGTLVTTLIYVVAGCAVQFAIGLGLALLCAGKIFGRGFFRVAFFLPLMITPVGIAYAFRMLADTGKGPFAPLWRGFGLEEFAWAADPWAAKVVVMVGDAWQWIPFIFIVMLAAVESVDDDQREAARVDGANPWQSFWHVTWPAIMPAAGAVVLIRAVEAFKIIDLPNVLTNGGPGVATESMALHSYSAWRALDLGGSAAVAYLLLIVSVVLCAAFFNVVVPRRPALQ